MCYVKKDVQLCRIWQQYQELRRREDGKESSSLTSRSVLCEVTFLLGLRFLRGQALRPVQRRVSCLRGLTSPPFPGSHVSQFAFHVPKYPSGAGNTIWPPYVLTKWLLMGRGTVWVPSSCEIWPLHPSVLTKEGVVTFRKKRLVRTFCMMLYALKVLTSFFYI